MELRLEPIKRSTLTAVEVAEYIGVSRDFIYILAREKRIPHFKIGSRVLFRKNAIDEWIESQMIEGMNNEEM